MSALAEESPRNAKPAMPAGRPVVDPTLAARAIAIGVHDLVVGFGDTIILDHLDLDVYRGEILGVIGASGSGKSVLTRAILGLLPKRAGQIEIFGEDVDTIIRRVGDLSHDDGGLHRGRRARRVSSTRSSSPRSRSA